MQILHEVLDLDICAVIYSLENKQSLKTIQ